MKKRMRKAVAIAATAAMVGSLPAGAVTAQAHHNRRINLELHRRTWKPE